MSGRTDAYSGYYNSSRQSYDASTQTVVSGRSGIGVGSASIVLISAVLCLTVFTLITYIVASNNKALVEKERTLVTGYYRAEVLAEEVLLQLLDAENIPSEVNGINIETEWDDDLLTDTISYSVPLSPHSEQKSLYVNLIIGESSYDILSWHMVDTDEWELDDSLNIW